MTCQTGATVIRARRLPGASSTAVHGLHLSDGTRLVLRRYVWPGFIQAEPDAPRREIDALRFASSWQLPVPELVAADETGHEVGDGIPVLLMTYLSGRAIGDPDLDRLAEVAATIHRADPAGFGHDYHPWYQSAKARPPAASTWPSLWEKAIELWGGAVPDYRRTFIHRDFHPGNVLWSRRLATGVVDWANACCGPVGCDVAHCRTNLIDLAGMAAADRFLAAYESLTGEAQHPYWEVAAILEHGPSRWTPGRLATDEPRLARAVQALSSVPSRP